jgi:predicted ABC-type ATPase
MTIDRPKLLIIAGPNGSGKTSVTSKILEHQWIEDCVYINPDKIDYIKRAKDAGYFIRLFFVGTDHPSINASRIARRVMEGGHDVPISKIISRFNKSIANCSIIESLVDRLYVYDNSVEYGEPKLLFRAANGKLEKIYTEINPWAQSILKALYS